MGVFDDMGKYGLFGGLKKSFGKKTVGGQTFAYDDLQTWQLGNLQWLFNTAVQEGDFDAAGWAFEAMIPLSQGHQPHEKVATAWHWAMYALQNVPEVAALPVTKRLVGYVDEYTLMNMQHGPWGAYLLGKVYLERTMSIPQYGKSGRERGTYKQSRKTALHFLGMARSKADIARQGASADPYRAAAMAGGLAAIAAASYEAASYFGAGKAKKFVGQASTVGVE